MLPGGASVNACMAPVKLVSTMLSSCWPTATVNRNTSKFDVPLVDAASEPVTVLAPISNVPIFWPASSPLAASLYVIGAADTCLTPESHRQSDRNANVTCRRRTPERIRSSFAADERLYGG